MYGKESKIKGSEARVARSPLRETLRRVHELTDRQFFGLINTALVNAASVYHAQKDIYSLERGLSPEQKAAEEEESNKGKKANELLNNFSNAAQGTYIWDGTDWVIEE